MRLTASGGIATRCIGIDFADFFNYNKLGNKETKNQGIKRLDSV